MDSFLALNALPRSKEQQQIALKLHNSNPTQPRFLEWALLSMVFQSPHTRIKNHHQPTTPISISITRRCLQTLIDHTIKSSTPLENPNKFWIIIKVLEALGQSIIQKEHHSKIIGFSTLKYPPSLFNFQSTNDHSKLPIQSRRPELPEYISLAREDYFKIFDSGLGQEMRKRYLNLELIWRQRAVEWANSNGLKELIDRMKHSLCSGDRNWSTMITLNQSVANLLQIDQSETVEFTLLDDLYVQLNAGQHSLKETERGYCLARVDLRSRFRDPTLSPNSGSSALDNHNTNLDHVICSYFIQFGDKTCCFDDLIPYLKLLTIDEATQLCAKLKQIASTDPDPPLCESVLRREINLEKILRSVTSYSADQQAIEATRLLHNYFQYLPLGQDLPLTTLQPADGLALLAAQALIQDWQGPDGSVLNLYSAVYILETCLSKSTHQYQARSLLIRLHRLLGNYSRTSRLFAEFGIKQIQNDTLSHLGLDRCSIFFSHTTPATNPENTESKPRTVQDLIEYPALIYEYIEADTLSWINNCYVDENYIQVEDLQFFKYQISSSLQRKVLRMERIRLHLFGKTRHLLDSRNKDDSTRAKHSNETTSVWDIQEVEMTLVEVLGDCQFSVDNRDFTVIPDCQPWSSSGTCHQTSLGPILGNRWLWTLGMTYARLIAPHLKVPDHPLLSKPDFFSECSSYEVDLHEYSKTLANIVHFPERHLLKSQVQNALNFFERRNKELENLTKAPIDGQDSTTLLPPSRLLAIIQNVYEGFCLFDFAFRQDGRSPSSPITKNTSALTVKTLGSMKLKILNQIKKTEGLLGELISTIDVQIPKQTGAPDPARKTVCCFGSSPAIRFPWRDDPSDQNFGNEANWNDFLTKMTTEQRQTLEGWHGLIKLIA